MITATNILSFFEKGVRDNNEDYIVSANDNCFIVCDGMGGHGHGDEASKTVAESLSLFFQSLPVEIEKINLQASLNYAIEQLNEKDVYGDDERKMGTTVVLAALTKSSLLVGHVGDSRLYHVRSGEGLLYRTKDHSQVQEWIDAEIITEEEARTHTKKNIITRCVQPHQSKPIVMEIVEQTNIQTGDYIFLCTDGVNDAMTDTEIIDIISSFATDEEKLELIKKCCAEKSNDNYSGFLLKIEADIVHQIVQKEEQIQKEERTYENNEVVYCRECENELNKTQKFCPLCGVATNETKKETIFAHCTKCGSKIDKEQQDNCPFCKKDYYFFSFRIKKPNKINIKKMWNMFVSKFVLF